MIQYIQHHGSPYIHLYTQDYTSIHIQHLYIWISSIMVITQTANQQPGLTSLHMKCMYEGHNARRRLHVSMHISSPNADLILQLASSLRLYME